MANYIWDGKSFGQTVFNVFLIDDNGNTWFWEQNYQKFFPFSLLSGVPNYTGNGVGQTLPANTNLSSLDELASYTSAFDASIINTRFSSFNLNSSNILSAATQNPTALINSAIASALNSNKNLQSAVASAAGLLTSPALNFALKDVSTWNGGTALVQQLQTFMNNHAANIASVTNAVKSVSDFKRKVLSQVTTQANALSKLQGQIDGIQSQGTFTAMVCAFPKEMGPINSMLNNSAANLTKQLTGGLIPSSAINGSSFVNGLFNSVLGKLTGQIKNPIDKIFLDLNKLEGQGLSIINDFPISGFTSLGAQTTAVNQVSALLNSITSQFPVTPTVAKISSVITDPTQIQQSFTQYIASQTGNITSNPALFANITSIQSLIANVIPPEILSAINGSATTTTSSTANATNPAKGGALTSVPALSSFVPTVYTPPVNNAISPDPTIAATQSSTAVQQTNTDQANSTSTAKPGDCINNINDVPLKPRSMPLDGGIGA